MSIFSKIKLFRSNNNENSKDINDIIDTSDNSSRELTPEEKNMLNNVIGFGESRVEDCMVPRADIVGLELDTDVKDILKIFSESNHSRIPVYKETLDNPIGMLHMKDLISVFSDKNFDDIDIEKFLREILFVPPSMKSRDLLVRMQTSRIHMALVIDEYGGTSGIITVEDIIEELIGEIEDEHDNNDHYEKKISNNVYEFSARLEIEYLNKSHNLDLPEGETYDTLGGLIVFNEEQIPKIEDEIKIDKYIIKILDATSSKIERVLVKKIDVL